MKAFFTNRRFFQGVLLLFGIGCSLSTFAQTIIWEDDFAAQSNGAVFGNQWQVVTLGGDCLPTPGVFAVLDSAFVIRDMEGSGCLGTNGGANNSLMRIGPVDVSTARCLQVGYTVLADGNFETSGPEADRLVISLILDSIVIDSMVYASDSTIQEQGLVWIDSIPNGRELTIEIRGGTQDTLETFRIRDILIQDASYTPMLSDFSLCAGDTLNLETLSSEPGTWSGPHVTSNQWFTSALSAGDYPLVFTPLNACADTVVVIGTLEGGSPAGKDTLFACSAADTAVFDLTLAADAIRNGAGTPVLWFMDSSRLHPVIRPATFVANDSTVVYGAFQEGASCLSASGSVLLRIQTPTPLTPIADVEACAFFVLPALDTGLHYQGYSAGDTLLTNQTITVLPEPGACQSPVSFEVTILSNPQLDAYTGPTIVCDSLELPPVTGLNLSDSAAYFSGPGGSGTRYEPGMYYTQPGFSTLYIYDESDGCSDEVSVLLDVGVTGRFNFRDTVVCDTFAFLPYTGPGTFQGYYSAANGGGTAFLPGQGVKRPPGTVYFYARAGSGSCIVEDSFAVTFRLSPDLVTISGLQDCDSIRLPEIGGQNLSGNEGYFTMPGGQGIQVPAGILIEETTSLYLYDRIGSCPDELLLPIIIVPTPEFQPVSDTIVCDTLSLPDIAGDLLTGNQAYLTGPYGTGTRYLPGDAITETQQLYLFDERSGCSTQDSFRVTVNKRPQFSGPIGERYVCDTFSLPPVSGTNLWGNEVVTTALYGAGDTLFLGTPLVDSTTLYLYGGTEGCRAADSLQLFINPQPVIFPQPDIDTCDYWVLPPVQGRNLTEYVGYYDDAEGQGELYFVGDTLFESITLYSYDVTEIGCEAAADFSLWIGLTPELAHQPDTVTCGSFVLPPITGKNLQAPAYLDDPFEPSLLFFEGQAITGQQQIYITDVDRTCVDTTSFSVEVIPQVVLETPRRDTMVCDALVLPPILGSALSGNEAYFDAPDAKGTAFYPGDIISDSRRLYIYDGRAFCTDQDTLDVYVETTPELFPIADVLACDYYVLPAFEGVHLTPAVTYRDEETGARFLPGDTLLQSRLMVAVDSNAFGCQSVQPFSVVVTPTPQLAPVMDELRCDSLVLPDIDGVFLPASASYYTDTMGRGIRRAPGAKLEASQQVYIYADTLGCRDEASFALSINYTPRVSNAMRDTTACFTLEIPELQGSYFSANTAYYQQAEGQGAVISPPLTLLADTVLYLYGNNANCYLRDTIEIAVNQLAADLVITDSIRCFGETGRIELRNVEGLSPLDIDWSNPALPDSAVLEAVPAGTYTLTLTDPAQCQLVQQIDLEQPDSLQLNCRLLQEVSVPNGADGSLALAFQGGTAPYQLVVSGSLTTNLSFDQASALMLDTLAAGTYTFTLEDNQGCQQSCSQTITAPPCLLEVDALVTDLLCTGVATGRIEAQVSHAQPPIQVNWSAREYDGLLVLDNLSAGAYAVTVTDANRCADSTAVSLHEPDPLSISVSTLTPVSSSMANDGRAVLQFAGGTAPYQLIYDGPQNDTILATAPGTLQVDSLRQGVYIFGLVDANNCRTSITLTITNANCAVRIDFAKTDQQCPNTQDGSLVPLVTGGLGPYRFVWQDGPTDSLRYNLSEGIYQLTVLDNDGCVTQARDTIRVAHPLPALSLSSDLFPCDSTCQTFVLDLAGTAPFQYSWELRRSLPALDTPIVGAVSGANHAVDSLTFCESASQLQLYIQSLEDAFCRIQLDTSFTMQIQPVPATLITDTLCREDTLLIAGQVFDWQHPEDTLVLANQAANGCDSLVYVDLAFRPAVSDTLRQTICREDSLLINGTYYHFGNPRGMSLFAGQSATGCDSVLLIDLAFHPVDTHYLQPVLCDRDSLELAGQVFSPTYPAAVVTLAGAAASGCDSIIDVEIDFVTQFDISLNTGICPDDSLWVNGQLYDRFHPIGREVLTSEAGCDSVITIDLQVLPTDTLPIRQALCPGDSLVVNGVVYNAENPRGLQRLEGAAMNGCDSLVQIAVTYLPIPYTLYQDTLCYLDTLRVNGHLYHNADSQGVEVLSGQAQNGCDSIVEISLTFRPPVTAHLEGAGALCKGAEVELPLNLSGAERYTITYQAGAGLPQVLTGLTTGAVLLVQPEQTTDYRVLSVEDMDTGCAGTPFGEKIQLTVSDMLLKLESTSTHNGFDISCAGAADGALQLQVTGGVTPYVYSWSNGATAAQIAALQAGNYAVTVSDAAGCRDSVSQVLLDPAPLELEWHTQPATCPDRPNGSIQLTAVAGGVMPYTYRLEGEGFRSVEALPLLRDGLAAGDYNLQLSDGNGCLREQTVQVAEEALRIELPGSIELTIGDSVQLQPQSNFSWATFNWQPQDNLSDARSQMPFVAPERTTTYTVTALDAAGCRLSAAVEVLVNQHRAVFVPSAFTPNEDGINDRFTIFGAEALRGIELLRIYDRWGNLLYEERGLPPSDDHFGWDGWHRGAAVPTGTYFYSAILRFNNGDEQKVEGQVILMR